MEQARTLSQEEPLSSPSTPSEENQGLSAGQYLDKALNLIGKKMRTAATMVRERGPREGGAQNAFESASKVLDTAGRYMMREHVTRDVSGIVKRYPGRSLAVCFVVGFLAGSVLRRSRA